VSTEVAKVLFAELETATKAGSSARRVEMLRRITDLFLSGADRLNEQQIGVFDDVLMRLIEPSETGTLAQLSAALSDICPVPRQVARQLAYHEAVAVARPVLEKCNRLADDDLIAIARTRSQDHLLAMSHRVSLGEPLTDVLVTRGDSVVSHALAANAGARFSQSGCAALVEKASRDDELVEKLVLRPDIPPDMFGELLARTTESVRSRLLQTAPPQLRGRIESTMVSIADRLVARAPKKLDFAETESEVLNLNRVGKLTDSIVSRFARDSEYAKVVAAIALLTSVGIDAIEALLRNPRAHGLVIACRAARLSWSTAGMILRNRQPYSGTTAGDNLKEVAAIFEQFPVSVAQRAILCWATQSAAKRTTSDPMLVLAANEAAAQATLPGRHLATESPQP
jgi:uncharacterized protein (DUF2336 family)